MPLMSIVLAGLFIATPWKTPQQSAQGVLAYATNTSVDGLLQETNNQRASSGQKSLSLNSKLVSAAQAKAADMVAKNYWSHTTPSGQQPWIFVDAAGYRYQKAGENLAYGFTTSSYTVAGWMNSPSHRDNMLDSNFSEVGFGIANAADYQSTGPETVVVAFYSEPAVLASSSVAPSSGVPTTSATKPLPKKAAAAAAPTPASAVPVAAAEPPKSEPKTDAITTERKIAAEPTSQNISRIQAITNGRMPWIGYATGLLTGAAIAVLILKHGLVLKRMLLNGERFIYHHALFDVTIVSFMALCIVSAHSVGVIR
ncbi:MAG: hypothetical protein JWS12_691 [Candidatus Saccharibacteria bacterium]|nr:hypothetical protein [Candidatus Saccharibacteria bacterium]